MQPLSSQYHFWAVPLPVPSEARTQARHFAQSGRDALQARQIYLNTLAVWLMKQYLHWMGLKTDLAASPSWNPVLHLCEDNAALQIATLGLLECRTVQPNQRLCQLPPETWHDRLGYVVIELSPSATEAWWLGFSPDPYEGQLDLEHHLLPPEALFDHIAALRDDVPLLVTHLHPKSPAWQQWGAPLSTLPESLHPLVPIRGPSDTPDELNRAKMIDLEVHLNPCTVTLLIVLVPQPNHQCSVGIRVLPGPGARYLPPHLVLTLLSETGSVTASVTARLHDHWMQLPRFSGDWGEQFQIQLQLNQSRITETFAL